MVQIQGFKSLRFLLTDSKVSRNTKLLVEGVAKLKLREPDVVNGILDQIQSISEEAQRALSDSELPREKLISVLSNLIEKNHRYLVSLGVSHPSLEKIREITANAPYDLKTKLTGAGGGGCAVTLIPDNFENSSLEKLKQDLVDAGFNPYITSVGGSGVGISSISSPTRPLTPPETSPEEISLKQQFETIPQGELVKWTAGQGSWAYV